MTGMRTLSKALTFVFIILFFPIVSYGHPPVTLLDENGVPVKDQLDSSDTITAAGGSVYMAGPAYSPKQTCGKCHDYQSITRAFHFREGAGPNGQGIDDHWSDKENDGTLYKYLANAYGHLLSPGQAGAW